MHCPKGACCVYCLCRAIRSIVQAGSCAISRTFESSDCLLQRMRLSPGLRSAFLVEDGGDWRPPHVNETTGRRPQLASLLQAGVPPPSPSSSPSDPSCDSKLLAWHFCARQQWTKARLSPMPH